MSNYKAIEVIQDEKKNAYQIKIEENKEVKHNDFILIDGNCRVAQEISQALKFFKGEYCNNIDLGVDYESFFEFYNKGDKEIAKAIIIEAISNIKDVISIDSLDFKEDRENYTLKITYKITTKYGTIEKGF